jgi:phosphate/sulfate permease
MWRLGFLGWQVWMYGKLIVPAALVLWLVHRVTGTSPLFWVLAVFAVGLVLGLRFGIRDLTRRELGTVGRERTR